MHTESSSSTPGSFSQTSLRGGVAAAAPHTLSKVFTKPSTLPAALLGVIATRAAGKGIVYGVSQGLDLEGTQSGERIQHPLVQKVKLVIVVTYVTEDVIISLNIKLNVYNIFESQRLVVPVKFAFSLFFFLFLEPPLRLEMT